MAINLFSFVITAALLFLGACSRCVDTDAPPHAELPTLDVSGIYAHPLEDAPEIRRVSSRLRDYFAALSPAATPTRPHAGFDPRDLVNPRRSDSKSEPIPILIVPSGDILDRVIAASAESDRRIIQHLSVGALKCLWFVRGASVTLPLRFMPRPDGLDVSASFADLPNRLVAPWPTFQRLDFDEATRQAICLESAVQPNSRLLWYIHAVKIGHVNGERHELRFPAQLALVFGEGNGQPDANEDRRLDRDGPFECVVTAPPGHKVAETSWPFLAPDPFRWSNGEAGPTPRERIVIPINMVNNAGGVLMVRRAPSWRPTREDLELDTRADLERLHAALVSTEASDEELLTLACALAHVNPTPEIRTRLLRESKSAQ